jgi:hypothetical protein
MTSTYSLEYAIGDIGASPPSYYSRGYTSVQSKSFLYLKGINLESIFKFLVL